MAQTREIITLQIGHYSNFVGTHWWNIQEASFCYDETSEVPRELNHDVLFREGKNLRGEVTYTPRLLAVDLKGSLKTLHQEGTLYDIPITKPSPSQIPWLGSLDVYRSESVKKNEFLTDLEKAEEALYPELKAYRSVIDEDKDLCQDDPRNNIPGTSGNHVTRKFIYDLDHNVDVWSDFLRIHFHPRTVCLIEDYFHQNEEEPFDLFGYGIQTYNNVRNQETLEDRIRKYAEECDSLQGYHILLDGSDGFAGLAKCVIQHLDDDYSNKMKFCFPLYQAGRKKTPKELVKRQEVHQLFNTLMCFDGLVGHSDIFSPLSVFSGLLHGEQHPISFPFLNLNAALPYHTSAILSAALDTITLPFRLLQQPVCMVEIAGTLAYFGRKLVTTSICLPFPMQNNAHLSSLVDSADYNIMMQPLTPSCQLSGFRTVTESVVLRGVPKTKWYSANVPQQQYPSAENMFLLSLRQHRSGSNSAVKVIESPCKVTAPYPNIFVPEVNSSGFLHFLCRPPDKGVDSIPMAAGLHSSDGVANILQTISDEASSIDFQKFHHCLDAGIELDDIAEAIQSLYSFLNNYVLNYEFA